MRPLLTHVPKFNGYVLVEQLFVIYHFIKHESGNLHFSLISK